MFNTMDRNQLTKSKSKHRLGNCLKRLFYLNANLSIALIYAFSGSSNFVFSNHIPDLSPSNFIEKRSLSPQKLPSLTNYELRIPKPYPVAEIIIIDGAIHNPETLVANLSPNTKVYYLNSHQDGIEQIATILNSHQNLQAIHILAHGRAGQLNLGAGVLNSLTLHTQAKHLKSWGKALASHGDILLYGCDFAQGAIGQAAIKTLANLTDADVAASDDYTGSQTLGGDWHLEAQVGNIESHSTLNYFAQSEYGYILVPTVANPDLSSNSCNIQIDLMFVLDESGSVNSTERAQQRTAVRETLQYMVDNNLNARAALVAFTTGARTLTSYVDVNATTVGEDGALDLAIKDYGALSGLTNWEAGFQEALTIANSTTYPDALFFFVDGTINAGNSPDRSPDDESDIFKFNGTHVYTVGIGNAISGTQLYRLTDGDPNNPPGTLPGSTDYNFINPNPVPADHVDITNYGNLATDFGGFFQDACLPSASLTKEFNANTIVPTEVSTLTFTINNIDGEPEKSDITFTDTFPVPLVIADEDPSTITNTCNGTLTDSSGATDGTEVIEVGDNGITLTGGSLALGQATCQISIKVTSNLDVATSATYTNDSNNITNGNNINTTSLNDDLTVNPFPISPLAGDLIINEVLYRQTGSGASGNDEFIELFNASGNAIDLTNFQLVDGNLLATDNPDADDGIESINGSSKSYTFGDAGVQTSGSLILPPGGYAIVWIGSQDNILRNAAGASFQAWLNQSPKLNHQGDDIWLFDSNTDLIDYVAYGVNNAINTRPDSWAQWDSTHEDKLDGAPTGQSISLTPNGTDGNTSACWEKTTIDESDPDSASIRCTNFLTTIDRDTIVIGSDERVTSAGGNNNGANLLLVKRITNIIPNRNNINFNTVIDDPNTDSDNDNKWINNYLTGQVELQNIQPGDEVEYTIYFLSNGSANANNVKLCDVISDNMTLVESGFGFNTGISLSFNSITAALSNDFDNDQGEFYRPNTNPPSFCQKVDSTTGNLVSVNSGNNLSGAIVVELDTSLPFATGTGIPTNSYGLIRFRAKVK